MGLLLGQTAPNFQTDTSQGEIDFYDFIGDGWVILFSHPADFTPICTTELGRMSQIQDEFTKRNTKILAVSVDSAESHRDWIKDINETQNTDVKYPIIADTDQKVAKLYGMIHPDALAKKTVRTVFIIGPNKKVRLTLTYPPSTGRNFNEILRALDSIQLTDDYSVSTPADWKDGDDVYVGGNIKTEDIPEHFPKGHEVIKPYLRKTPQPNK
ncbi:MAG TPA: peroxiredoxin [Chitinophagaceae bacterium]|nr:peroxiredoxin [Chitinophagaceae bacterium]